MAAQPLTKPFLALILLAAVLLASIAVPLAKELVVAAVLAGVLWPVQKSLTKRLHDRPGASGALLVIATAVILLGPVTAIITIVAREGSAGLRFVFATLNGPSFAALVDRLPASLADAVRHATQSLPRDLGQAVAAGDRSGRALSTVGRALSATGLFAYDFVLMVIALFFMLVRGNELVGWLECISPLGRAQTIELFTTFRKVSYSVIVSTSAVATIQATAGLIGYAIAGVPSPVFFALLTLIGALVPGIGATSVCLFAALLVEMTGHTPAAVFLVVWGSGLGVLDHFVKPLLMRRGIEIDGAIVFFSLLGGIATYGAVGVLLGPMFVALFITVMRIYRRDYAPSSEPCSSDEPAA
jgi:predicted PurR-regulated permease PerM